MIGRATHARSRNSEHETACGIPLSNVLVGKPNCIRCLKAKKRRTVQTAEEARKVWHSSLAYLSRHGKLTTWAEGAWQQELVAREFERRARIRERDRLNSQKRRSNMTLEARRQEWNHYQRVHRARLKEKP